MPFVFATYVFLISNAEVMAGPPNNRPDASVGSVSSVAIVRACNEKDLVRVRPLRLSDLEKSVPKIYVPLVGEVEYWKGQYWSALAA